MPTKKTSPQTPPPFEDQVDYGPAGEQKVKNWKKEFGDVGYLQIPLVQNGETLECHAYIRRPNFREISLAFRYRRDDPVKAGQVFVENCLLEVSPQLKENAFGHSSLCVGAFQWVNQMTPLPTIDTF